MRWEMLGGANGGKGRSLWFHTQFVWKKKFSFQIYNEAECQRKVTYLKGTDSLAVKGEKKKMTGASNDVRAEFPEAERNDV